MNKASKDAFKLVDERVLAEKVLSSDPAIAQVREIGVDARNYRDLVGLPQVAKEAQERHNHYVHRLGADVLQTLLSDAKLQEIEREKALKKQSKLGQLLRRKIKVTDFADGGISIAIEQDWDTSSWNDNLIEAGCEALLFVFQDLGEIASHEKKAAALQMLQKLLSRHKAADVFLRKNMEMLIMKATSHLIRGGVSGGILNLLWVLNGCKHLFLTELSNYKFNGRALDMLMVEAKIAAILIQHTFRAKRSKKQLLLENQDDLQHMKGFGTDKDRYYRKLRVINSRSTELRNFWRHFHNKPNNNSHNATGRRASQSIRNNALVGGMRGPIHIQQYHVTLTLQTLSHLVSDHAGSHAHGNREDIVKAQGCILLSTFLGCPASPFATLAAKILAEVSKVAESFAPLVHSGVITSAFRYMKHVRTIHGVGTKVISSSAATARETRPNTRQGGSSMTSSQMQQQQSNGEYQMLLAFLNCFDIIINTGIHASGLYRAYHGYDFIKPAYGTTEAINYQDLLNALYAQTTFTTSITDYIKRKHVEINHKHKINAKDNSATSPGQQVRRATIGMKTTSSLTRNMDKILQEVTLLLCNSYLLQELSTIICVTEQMSIVKKALLCLLTLLSSHAHVYIVETITAKAGTLMIRLMQLLEHEDRELSLLALLIFLQCNTMHNSRQSMFIVHIAKFILDLQQRLLAPSGNVPASRPTTSNSAYSYSSNHQNVTSCSYIHNEVFGRLLLLCLSLCRQFDWRFYDIHTLYQQALAKGSDSTGPNDFIKQSIYLNLLISMKVETLDKTTATNKMTKRLSKQYTSNNLLQNTHTQQNELNLPEPPVVTHSNVLILSVSDYILIPNNFELCLALSKQYSLFTIQPLLFYLVHPDDIFFYEKLPLHESIAVCQIIEGLSAYSPTARSLYHSSSILFLMKFIYLNKYLFLGKEMPGINVIMLFNGIKATFVGLGRICAAITNMDCASMVEEYVTLMRYHEFLSNAMFFLDTLVVFNPTIPLEILQLQKEVGICAVEYFNKYACMLNFLQYEMKRGDVGNIEDLYEIAKMCVQILHKLHETYQVYFQHHPEHVEPFRKEEIHIHSVLCSFLSSMTKYKASAFMALNDWDVQPALLRYVPAPLSGFPSAPPSLSLTTTQLSDTAPYSSSSKAPIHARPSPYALELLELPATFFTLCSHLCLIDIGMSFCLACGFLRRALDKLHLLHKQLIDYKVSYRTQQYLSLLQWDDRKYDFASCLHLVTVMANYHDPKEGNVNDLILSPLYDLVEVCKSVLELKIPRHEEVIYHCYACLCALSKDSFRLIPLFEKHNILSIVQKELYLCDNLPIAAALMAVDTIHHVTHGLTSPYIIQTLPLLRESLGKTSRVYGEKVGESVRRAHWTLTKSAMIYKTTVDAEFKVDGGGVVGGTAGLGGSWGLVEILGEEEKVREIQVEIEEYIRTGKNIEISGGVKVAVESKVGGGVGGAGGKVTRKSSTFSTAYIQRLSLQDDNIDSLRKHPHKAVLYYAEKEEKGAKTDTNGVNANKAAETGTPKHFSPPRTPVPSTPKGGSVNTETEGGNEGIQGGGDEWLGTYCHIGVSTHGSLKLPPLSPYPASSSVPPSPASQSTPHRVPDVFVSPRSGIKRFTLSQLSAREEKLVQEVRYRKHKSGYVEDDIDGVDRVISSPMDWTYKKKTKEQASLPKKKGKGHSGHRRMESREDAGMMQALSVNDLPDLKLTRPPK